MFGPIDIKLEDYGVSLSKGFLPPQAPLKTLPNTYYQPWETIICKLPKLISTYLLRQEVDKIPVLSTEYLKTEPEWQRAYSILCFITHGYIWGGSKPSEILPPAISRPFLEISHHLELPPTATYSGLNLWNFATTSASQGETDDDENDWSQIENLSCLTTFTGTRDEEWFYLVSAAMEARCAPIIPTMLHAITAAASTHNDSTTIITRALEAFSECALDLGILLDRMYERCDPQVFYHDIRPFLTGSKNMAAAGLPRGVFYDVGDGHGDWRQYSGGSNAQSSLIQFLDGVLGVVHQSTGEARPDGTPISEATKKGFLHEMRTYMPGPHRRFLTHVTTTSTIRTYIQHQPPSSPVIHAFNLAVQSLTKLRDKHIVLVTRYIIVPSQQKLAGDAEGRLNLATVSMAEEQGELTGTGGTMLIPFLKMSRDETRGTACGV